MEEFQVHICLRNGREFDFFKKAGSKEEVIHEITNQHGNGWYHFITKDYVKYQVLKSEIVGFGISLSHEKILELES